MSTAKTKINVHDGKLSMRFDGAKICFNIYDAMKYPCDDLSIVSMIDIIDPLVDAVFEFSYTDNAFYYGFKY